MTDGLPQPPRRRSIVVNADDLGLSHGVNSGIVDAHRRGVVTSASLMVCRTAVAEAIALTAECPDLSIGLHLDLDEHQVRDGSWLRVRRRVDLDDVVAVDREVRHQVDRFVELVGVLPTHLDSHQHCHMEGVARTVSVGVARELDVPLRGVTLPYRGDFYGQYGPGLQYPDGITPDALLAAIASCGEPLSEISCHPAALADVDDVYRAERVVELRTLCDPDVPTRIAADGVRLVNRSGRTRSRVFAGPAAR